MKHAERPATPDSRDSRQFGCLPRERPLFATRRRVAISIAGALVTLALLNTIAFFALKKYPINRGYWLLDKKWQLLEQTDKPVEWLIIGDSSGNQGLIPARLSESLEGTALNLCVAGGPQVHGDLWLLEVYLRKMPPPSQVIMVHAYDVWPREIRYVSAGRFPWRWSQLATGSFPKSMTFRDRIELCFSRYLPVYYESNSIYKMLRWAIIGRARFKELEFEVDAGGYMRWDKSVPREVRADMNRHLRRLDGVRPAVSANNRLALENIAALAERHDFELIVVNGPLFEGLYSKPEFRDYFETVQTELRRYAAGSENIHYLEDVFTFPAEEMENVDHLIQVSAERYTDSVAEAIGKLVPETR